MPAVMGNKEIHKLFDRSTPAGAAMYVLYNASENESRTAGNAYSKRNAVRIAAQGRRAMLKAAMEPEREHASRVTMHAVVIWSLLPLVRFSSRFRG